jgi:hypothetical protein
MSCKHLDLIKLFTAFLWWEWTRYPSSLKGYVWADEQQKSV